MQDAETINKKWMRTFPSKKKLQRIFVPFIFRLDFDDELYARMMSFCKQSKKKNEQEAADSYVCFYESVREMGLTK